MGMMDMFNASEKATITVPELVRLIDGHVRYDLTKNMLQADVEPMKMKKVLGIPTESEVEKDG